MDQLAKDFEMLGVNKKCATVPCDVFAAALDPGSAQRFRQIDPKKMNKDENPKSFDTGIHIDADFIYKMTKHNAKKNAEAKCIQLL